ncbi:MAG: sulfite exporter TauE/SafE family protein [Clostridia bacterium]|nr:sulfite exporter TauE/SafE family protein [Clostridia bacterium]
MRYINEILFFAVILIANVIQGITGFAGTVLAMPPAVMLVGLDTAKPILNLLGLLSGLYVVVTAGKYINKKEFFKTSAVMTVGIIAGIFIKDKLHGNPEILYIILGVVVTAVGVIGAVHSFILKSPPKKQGKFVSWLMLTVAGVVHGLFVCGGPLIVSYFSAEIEDKNEFRSTISAVWVVLNGFIFIDDLRMGHWHADTVKLFVPAAVVMVAAMFIGSILYKKMSRSVFMKVTFVLLMISGVALLLK